MELKNSVIDLIKERISTRTYDGRALEEKDVEKLNYYIDEIIKDTKLKVRFKIISNLGIEKDASKKLGTYGFISGANSYVIGILDKNDNDAFEFGYIFEKVVLAATDLNIQTCWLGGTFSKDSFEQISELSDNEFIPIITPVGYKKDKRRVFETAMRASIGADKRKPWSELFFNKDMSPLSENDVEEYKVPLEMVRLGPSASNKQPWRIIKDGDKFHFYLCKTKGYGLATFDMQLNDIGIAKCHFELTAKELGIRGNWEVLQQTDKVNDWEYVVSWKSNK